MNWQSTLVFLACFVPQWMAGDPAGVAAVGAGAAAALRAYADRAEQELRRDILPFWMERAKDPERGGFYGRISNDLTVNKNATRGSLLTARILWTYSAAFRRYQEPAYREMARWAYQDLIARFWDETNSGIYWTATADGKPRDTSKQIYDQVFGIYALSEYFRVSGDKTALDRALAIYRAIEQHAHDRQNGGYFEAYSRDWQPITRVGANIVGGKAAKSQNTHLHIMEAYTNLLRVWPDPELRRNQRELVELMLTRILNPANRHLHLFLEADWKPRSDGISFGHDIECSWLLVESAEVLGDADLIARARAAAVEIARVTLAEGVDRDGGVFNEAGPRGLTDTNKDWWPQAEAAVGFLNAYEISGEDRFLRASLASWDFIDAHLIDHKNGEWFRAVTRDGTLARGGEKVGLWKCPYHNGRACLELVERLRTLAEKSEAAAK